MGNLLLPKEVKEFIRIWGDHVTLTKRQGHKNIRFIGIASYYIWQNVTHPNLNKAGYMFRDNINFVDVRIFVMTCSNIEIAEIEYSLKIEEIRPIKAVSLQRFDQSKLFPCKNSTNQSCFRTKFLRDIY